LLPPLACAHCTTNRGSFVDAGDMERNGMKVLVSTKVLSELTEKIENGEWKPGEKLPSLSALAAEFSISVSTLREVMRILEEKGFVLIEHGRGIFVRAQSYWRSDDMFELSGLPFGNMASLLEFRNLLEPEMARLAAERGSIGQIRLIKEAASRMIANIEKGEDYFEADIAFHEYIAEACANEIMAKVIKDISDLLLESRRNTIRIPGSAERASHFHMLIALAIEQRNPQMAKEMMSAHLNDVKQDFLKLRELETMKNIADREDHE